LLAQLTNVITATAIVSIYTTQIVSSSFFILLLALYGKFIEKKISTDFSMIVISAIRISYVSYFLFFDLPSSYKKFLVLHFCMDSFYCKQEF